MKSAIPIMSVKFAGSRLNAVGNSVANSIDIYFMKILEWC